MYVVKRSHHNPLITPDHNHYWEASATFNLSPIKKGDMLYGLYRAMSAPDKLATPKQVSVIALAESRDGDHFENSRQFLAPEADWDKFGCEDPRVTFFEGKYYIFYTALGNYPFNADGIKCAVAVSPDLQSISERHLVTPFNAKAMALFPERINGKVTVILSAHTDAPPAKMAIAQADRIEDLWSPAFWTNWEKNIDQYVIDPRRSENDHIEVGAVPLMTERGWLLIYSHIQNYFRGPEAWPTIFGIEALLLDQTDPRRIIGRTRGPLLVPEETYELAGYVPNVVFPSGAMTVKEKLYFYYGAADTTVCRAKVDLVDLLKTLDPQSAGLYQFKRSASNPILSPDPRHPWEAKAVFNPAAIDLDGRVHLLYRALSEDNTSTIGYAVTENGETITERLLEPIYVPRAEFEMKKIAGGNSGCEDPRLTLIGKRIYMCYTAFDSVGPPRVAVSSISESDFLARRWNWDEPQLITPPGVDDKDTCLFPEKINDKYFLLHRIGNDICGDDLESLDFAKEKVNKCIMVFGPRPGYWDGDKVGISAPPFWTKKGWLLLYHGVSKCHHTYRVGAVLLDAKDPTTVLARTTDAIFEPQEIYEKEGVVNNVVFPCGLAERDGLLHIYYGAADRVTGAATIDLENILGVLERGAKL
jgi:predicted GH43/DUF377 family glycosyl hydrolase